MHRRGVLGDMRGHVHGAQIRDEVARVIGFVRRDGNAVPSGAPFDHHQGRIAFAMAVGWRDRRIDNQPRPMLQDHMPQVTEVRLAAPRFPIEPGIRVGGRLMRVIGPKSTVGLPPPAGGGGS